MSDNGSKFVEFISSRWGRKPEGADETTYSDVTREFDGDFDTLLSEANFNEVLAEIDNMDISVSAKEMAKGSVVDLRAFAQQKQLEKIKNREAAIKRFEDQQSGSDAKAPTVKFEEMDSVDQLLQAEHEAAMEAMRLHLAEKQKSNQPGNPSPWDAPKGPGM